MKGMTKDELKAGYERERAEAARYRLAMMLMVGSKSDGVVTFHVGDPGERERYDLQLFGAMRADGGTVVQIRRCKGAKLPDVEVFGLDDLRVHCQCMAAGHLSDFNVKRRDAVDTLAALAVDMFNELKEREAMGGKDEAPAGA
jgi:hypothetical protein